MSIHDQEGSLISIIVPVYNTEKYLARCLDSLLHQSLKNLEIICINDGSTDSSKDILESYARRYDKIKIYSQKNLGPGSAKNLGLKAACGKYIMFCDSDDFYHPEMCMLLFKSIENNNTDVAMCGMNVIYETDNNLVEHDKIYYQVPNIDTEKCLNLINKINVSNCNKIFKSEIIKKFCITYPEKYKYEDNIFFIKYFSVAGKCSFITDKLYNRTRRYGSTMNITMAKRGNAIEALINTKYIYKFFMENDLMQKMKQIFCDYYINTYFFAKNNSYKFDRIKIITLNWIYVSFYRIKFKDHHMLNGVSLETFLKNKISKIISRPV